MRSFLRPEASVRNPIDLAASVEPEEFRRCLQLLMRSDEVDSVIVIYVPRTSGSAPAILKAVRETAAAEAPKALVTVCMQCEGIAGGLEWPCVPNYLFPEAAAKALARATRYGQWRKMPEGQNRDFPDVRVDVARGIVERALTRLGEQGGWLAPAEAYGVLAAFGFPLPRWDIARTANDAIAAARRLDGPVALKAISPSTLHKSDRGGVALDLEGDAEVREAFDRVTSQFADAQGALVQEYVPGGHEGLVGVTRDAAFGPLIAFGVGGVRAELIGDAALGMHPLTDRDAAEMIGELRSAPALDGYRGAPAADKLAIKELLTRVSALVGALPQIAEMDLNPVKLLAPGRGARVVDCRIRVVQG